MQAEEKKMSQNPSGEEFKGELIRLDRMYESLRYNDYSAESGLGEIVDNSIEARAAKIAVTVNVEKIRKAEHKRASDAVTEIAVSDDGYGMDPEMLGKCLVLGESIRRSDKKGIGRFGVGMTLGSISLARRIEVFSRAQPEAELQFTYIDLDEIQEGDLIRVPVPIAKNPDPKYMDLLEGSSGTLVVLKKCDRIAGNLEGLANYLGRTYRKFIEAGVSITLNNENVYLHDPLYMAGPTVFDAQEQARGKVDPKAKPLGTEKITLPVPGMDGETADVIIRMTLLPKEWRLEKGSGGSKMAKERKIPQNEGVSILRADREVLYGNVPYITGKKGEATSLEIDRWWGCEISFPPELDDYFQVRYIKRGAEPIPSLLEKIRQVIQPTVKAARKEIQDDWTTKLSEESQASGVYGKAEETMAKVDRMLPRSKKGQGLTPEEAEQKIDEILDSLGDDDKPTEAREKKKADLMQKPYVIESVQYPPTFLLETSHILDKVILRLNVNHPFYKHVLLPLCGPLDSEVDAETINKSNDLKDAILLLLFSYAKAEATFSENTENDQLLQSLRSQWGTFLAAAINEYEKEDRR